MSAAVAIEEQAVRKTESIEKLVQGCELLVQQYDSSASMVMGGNLTNEPFLMIREAMAELKASTETKETKHLHRCRSCYGSFECTTECGKKTFAVEYTDRPVCDACQKAGR